MDFGCGWMVCSLWLDGFLVVVDVFFSGRGWMGFWLWLDGLLVVVGGIVGCAWKDFWLWLDGFLTVDAWVLCGVGWFLVLFGWIVR